MVTEAAALHAAPTNPSVLLCKPVLWWRQYSLLCQNVLMDMALFHVLCKVVLSEMALLHVLWQVILSDIAVVPVPCSILIMSEMNCYLKWHYKSTLVGCTILDCTI